MTEKLVVKNKIARVIQTLMSLQAGRNNHVDDLMKINQCSRRTVFRDLDELKKIGVEYDYDRNQQLYSLHDDQLLSPPDLSYKEAMVLLLIVQKAKSRLQIPFEKTALLATLKIENSLSPPIRKYCREVLSNITVSSGFRARSEIFDDMYFSLLTAIHKKRIVTFSYNLDSDIKCDITLNPYHLYYCGHRWYLVGKSHFHNKITHFRLNLIKNLELSEKLFIEKNTLNIHEYIGNAWQIESDSCLYNVKLRFSEHMAKDVTAVQWHKSQRITRQSDGSIIMEFMLHGLDEITFWILGHGDHVEVLSPKVLRKKVIKTVGSIASLYAIED